MTDSLPALLRAAEGQADSREYLDLCLVFRHRETKITLLECGGRWDTAARQWSQQEPESARIFELGESQREFFEWAARWLADFRDGHERQVPRQVLDRLVLAEGGRRGGKTSALTGFLAGVAVDMPYTAPGRPLRSWVVSKSHEEEDEVHEAIRQVLPPQWLRWRERARRYELPHGSAIHLLSADRPHTTKRGRVDIALINEAQKQPQKVLTNMIYGVSDAGGVAMLAANPHDTLTGEWVAKVLDKVKAGKYPRAKHFHFDPRKNPFVDQVARADVDELVRDLDPRQADRDGGGIWLPLSDHAYFAWSDERHVRPAPQLGDVTNQVLRRKLGHCTYTHIAGLDFQRSPGCCATIWRLTGDPAQPILHGVGEIVIERGSEYVLSDALYDAGYEPDDLLLIADATGQQQDYEHRPGQDSFSKLRSRGWHVEAPQKKRSTKGKHSVNPPIPERLKLVNDELSADRVQVDAEQAPMLAHCFKECILKPGRYSTRVPSGEGWLPHLTDAAGYVIYWLKPPPLRPLKRSSGTTTPAVARPAGGAWWPK